jgi:hypothetical protein
MSFTYFSYPTVNPRRHYIFDIHDGWYDLNELTFGLKNSLYTKTDGCVRRIFSADLYAHAFFDVRTFQQVIPRAYSHICLYYTQTFSNIIDFVWNIEHNQVDHYNVRWDWTVDEDFAISAEYRHRDRFSWRKVDEENFFLDVFRKEEQLLHSSLSDRRDTLLLHFFYRFHPNWSTEVASRQGWNRRFQPNFIEYECNVMTTIQTAWHIKFSFQHRQNDNRVAIYLDVGLPRPDREKCGEKVCRYN